MRSKTLAALACLSLLLSAPAMAQAGHPGHPGEERHHRLEQHPRIDWSAYPADVQAYKKTLDQLKEQQKALFEQFKQQRMAMRSAREKMTDDQRETFKSQVQNWLIELKSARQSIRSLSEQKHDAWEHFRQHASSKQWEAAKADMQTIIAKKREIIGYQQKVLALQKKIVEKLPQ
jgi:multidrug resistance efflux pump